MDRRVAIRLVCKILVLSLLLLVPTSAWAQTCSFDFGRTPNGNPLITGYSGVISGSSTTFTLGIYVREFTPGGCNGQITTSILSGSTWITSIAVSQDASDPLVWRWRFRTSGNPPPGTLRRGQICMGVANGGGACWAFDQDVSSCSASAFESEHITVTPDGATFSAPIRLTATNGHPTFGPPCNFSFEPTFNSEYFIGQFPVVSHDPIGGMIDLFPDGIGSVPANQLRVLTTNPTAWPNDSCFARRMFVLFDLNDTRQISRVEITQDPIEPLTSISGFRVCYGKVRARIRQPKSAPDIKTRAAALGHRG